MLRLFITLFILACIASPCWAVTNKAKAPVKRASIVKPKVQAHYSLIDGKPIHGQITQQSTLPSLSSCSPEAGNKPAPTLTPSPATPVASTVLSSNSNRPTKKYSRFFKTFFNPNRITPKEQSWVSGITEVQAGQLAEEIETFLETQTTPQNTTLLLAAPVKKQWNNPLTPKLESRLRQTGFAISQSLKQTPNAQILRYQVEHVGDTGVLLRLSFQGKEATRLFFTPDNRNLVSYYPFSIRLQGDPE